MSETGDTLRASLAQHVAAKGQGGRRPVDWKDRLKEARRLRLKAAKMDPERTDPQWQAEQDKTPRGADTNAVFLAFYDQVLDR